VWPIIRPERLRGCLLYAALMAGLAVAAIWLVPYDGWGDMAAILGFVILSVVGIWLQQQGDHDDPDDRWRRGECAACGYPRPAAMQPGDRCSECGAALGPPTA
jgi:hypothetical protein